MAGLPVIASDWRFNKEIVKIGETGYIFEAKNIEALSQCIEEVIADSFKIYNLKNRCLKYSEDFKPENVMKPLTQWLHDA